jgi:hypothetical protein
LPRHVPLCGTGHALETVAGAARDADAFVAVRTWVEVFVRVRELLDPQAAASAMIASAPIVGAARRLLVDRNLRM